MVGYEITDDDFKAVIRLHLIPEMITLYHTLNEQGASLMDICCQLISLEAHIARPVYEAHLNDHIRTNFDQRSQRSISRYASHNSASTGASRD